MCPGVKPLQGRGSVLKLPKHFCAAGIDHWRSHCQSAIFFQTAANGVGGILELGADGPTVKRGACNAECGLLEGWSHNNKILA